MESKTKGGIVIWNKSIQAARNAKGFSKKYVAEKTQISVSTYRRLEKGENVGIIYVQQVAEFLEIKIDI